MISPLFVSSYRLNIAQPPQTVPRANKAISTFKRGHNQIIIKILVITNPKMHTIRRIVFRFPPIKSFSFSDIAFTIMVPPCVKRCFKTSHI